ncbi:MAG: hypothetical protein COA79_02600 [Planctomycetota bacterium]|nr:MAG: hypothetical protein COA79_02600 [Planctomycetota bacterium]
MDDDAAKRLAEQLKASENEDASHKAVSLIQFQKGEKVDLNPDDEDDVLIDDPVYLVEQKKKSKVSFSPFKKKLANIFIWSLFILFDLFIGFIIYIYFL